MAESTRGMTLKSSRQLRTTALSMIAVAAIPALIVSSMNYSKLQSFVVINNIQNTVFVNTDPAVYTFGTSSLSNNNHTTTVTPSTRENKQASTIEQPKRETQQQQDEQIKQEVRLEFVHIPKTGGTSIEKAVLASRHKIRWGIKQSVTRSNRTHRSAPPEFYKLPYWHAPPTYFRDPTWDPYGPNIYESNNNNTTNNTIRMFAVVRNPYTRAVSEYHYWFRDVKRQPGAVYNVDRMNAWLSRMLQPLYDVLEKKNDTTATSTYSDGAVVTHDYKTIDTSDQWRQWRNHQTDAFRAAYYANKGHLIPQYDFVYDGSLSSSSLSSPPQRPIIHHILRFENLANEFHALMRQYNLTGIRIANTKLQKTRTLQHLQQQVTATAAAVSKANNVDKNNVTLVAAATRAATELAQYTRPKAGVANLTLTNRQLIQDIYARDFAAFGYNI